MLQKIFTILAVLSAVSAKTSWENLDNYSFEQYLEEFNLKYNPSELEFRRSIFDKELQRVRDHNSKSLSWKEGVTKFSSMTPDEKKTFFGRSKGMAQHQKKSLKNGLKLPEDFKIMAVEDLPRSVDWREKDVVSAVKDQGHCGSCWAFASTATIESHVALNSGLLFDLSVQQIASCTPNPDSCGGGGGCTGATSELAFDYVANSTGLFQEYQHSYLSYYGDSMECNLPESESPVASIDGFVKLTENNYEELMNAVANIGPISVSVDASKWGAYESGIFDGCDQETPDINHAVILTGYGEENGQKYWLIRNSWSPSYGEQGYIRVLRTDSEETRCGMDVTPQDGTACAGETDPVQVCGTCGMLFDSAYPVNAKALK